MKCRHGLGALLCILSAHPALAQYTAVRLQPPGNTLPTFVTGVDGNLRVGYDFTFPSHGFVWTGSNSTPQDFGASSAIYAISGTRFGGSQNGQACFWDGSPAARTDLGPSGTSVTALSGNQQVGTLLDASSNPHATLWTGTAASRVDLSPPGFQESRATGTDGDRQYGWGIDANDQIRALAWNDTIASVQDFTPALGSAQILAAGGGVQVGGSNGHAAMWSGTAASFLDLNPAGYSGSLCEGTNGAAQVGYLVTPGGHHASLWLGSASSYLDLHSFLPAGYTTSEATCVTMDSGHLVIGGYASNGTASEAFIWVGIPAPASTLPFLATALLTLRRRR